MDTSQGNQDTAMLDKRVENEYEDHLSHWVSFLNDNGTIYITDICLDNIFNMFFTPYDFNGNEVTDNTINDRIIRFILDKVKTENR